MTARTYATITDSPLGELTLLSDGTRLRGVYQPVHKGAPVDTSAWQWDAGPFRDAVVQLEQYFAGERTVFDVPLGATGTPFQQQVWDALKTIPYGATATYRDIAGAIGSPKAVRAVGLANGRNPISIIVPCHRVVGANGALTGYGGGLAAKQLLLDLESRVAGLLAPAT
jgi:methylated-DNA-[protein]-cysteine S-methyltransferase